MRGEGEATSGATVNLPRYPQLLAQYREGGVEMPAIVLDNCGELVAVRHLHADAVDIDVLDLVIAAVVAEVLVDPDRLPGLTHDLAAHDDSAPFGRLPVTGTAVRRIREPVAIGPRDVFLEQLQELLLLFGTRRPPVAAEHELADAGDIEIGAEQLAEMGGTLSGRYLRAERLDRLLADLTDELLRVLCGDPVRRRGRNEQEQGGCCDRQGRTKRYAHDW